jgi:hypothetical protein
MPRVQSSNGGNIHFLAAPDGIPWWVSDIEPGSAPDITTAGLRALPALYTAAADGMPTPVDKRSIGAGVGPMCPPAARRARPSTHIRALGDRGAAEPEERRRTLKLVTLSSCRSDDIAPRRTRPQPAVARTNAEKTSMTLGAAPTLGLL